ncbi:MAG: hypothetical protein CL933_26200 [Deltaproteobacteria bacterium]|nr:hypothetical protein [Deltaproteobacteria bacterium]
MEFLGIRKEVRKSLTGCGTFPTLGARCSERIPFGAHPTVQLLWSFSGALLDPSAGRSKSSPAPAIFHPGDRHQGTASRIRPIWEGTQPSFDRRGIPSNGFQTFGWRAVSGGRDRGFRGGWTARLNESIGNATNKRASEAD